MWKITFCREWTFLIFSKMFKNTEMAQYLSESKNRNTLLVFKISKFYLERTWKIIKIVLHLKLGDEMNIFANSIFRKYNQSREKKFRLNIEIFIIFKKKIKKLQKKNCWKKYFESFLNWRPELIVNFRSRTLCCKIFPERFWHFSPWGRFLIFLQIDFGIFWGRRDFQLPFFRARCRSEVFLWETQKFQSGSQHLQNYCYLS